MKLTVHRKPSVPFDEKVRNWRVIEKLSPAVAASQTGLCVKRLAEIERGARPSPDEKNRLRRAFLHSWFARAQLARLN